jgi:hypothetical protein
MVISMATIICLEIIKVGLLFDIFEGGIVSLQYADDAIIFRLSTCTLSNLLWSHKCDDKNS